MENINLKQFARVGRVFPRELSKEIQHKANFRTVRALTGSTNLINK